MMGYSKYCLWLFSLVACCHCAFGQMLPGDGEKPSASLSPDSVSFLKNSHQKDTAFTVREIVLVGNKKTREEIMLREIPFKPGEKYILQDLVNKFEIARKQLMNTALFHEVVVALKSFEGYNVDVLVQVKERWYIFPVPYFKPVDRNLNQWIVEQKASFTRVNYGAKLLYNNFTGRNDKLRAWFINGYTKQ